MSSDGCSFIMVDKQRVMKNRTISDLDGSLILPSWYARVVIYCKKSSSSIDSFVDTTLVSLWFFLPLSSAAIEKEAAAVIV